MLLLLLHQALPVALLLLQALVHAEALRPLAAQA